MLVMGSNYVRTDMGKLFPNKIDHCYRRVCIMSKNVLLASVFYVLQSKDDIHVSQTPHQIHHTACKQVSLWDITCILDVASKPHQRETAENRRETNHIVY